MSLNLEKMLTPLLGDSPSGDNLEYDPLYLSLDELASGSPPSSMGDSVIEGKDSDWRQLNKNCLELWERTRDLRVAVYLTIASLFINRLEGMRDGLTLVKYLTENMWTDFWPRVDPSDDNDPTERINILTMLSPQQGSYSDPLMFISRFRDIQLLEGTQYTVRDLLVASGEQDAGDAALNIPLFNAEMSAIHPDIMKKYYNTVCEIENLLNDISDLMSAKTGGEASVNFTSLLQELKSLRNFYKSHIDADESEPIAESLAEAVVGGNVQVTSVVSSKHTAFNLDMYRPASRAEALTLLRKSAEYFKNSEPTNPVPYLLERAIRIADMNFIDLLGDIDKGSLDRVKEQLGILNND